MNNYQMILDAFLHSCRFLMKYNMKTNELYVIKSEEGMHASPETPYDPDEYLKKFLASGVVYKEDVLQFQHIFEPGVLEHFCERGQNGSLIVYRRTWEDQLIWSRVLMFVPQDYSDENPYVLIFNRDMPYEEAMVYESAALLGKRIHKIIKANLTKDEFYTIKEYPSEAYIHRNQPVNGFTSETAFIKEGFVHPADELAFERHMNHEYIRNYFREGNREYQFYYRRKVSGLWRWVRLTIIPASEYDMDNEVLYYYVTDEHKAVLKLLDIRAATDYAQFFANKNKPFSQGYYENLLQVLSTFTQPYYDFYMIDLEKDLYINYKISNSSFNSDIPYIGNYSQISSRYIRDNYSGHDAEMLKAFSTSTKIQELMKDKLTMDYTFTYPNGQRVTTTFLKIESRGGVPTKVTCSTMPAISQDKLVIRTFGNFEAMDSNGSPIHFSRQQSRQLLAYLVDRHGYPVTSKDIVLDILEKDPTDLKAIKYVSTLIRRAISDLREAGYPDVIIKEPKSVRINTDAVDCDYYHFLNGEPAYWKKYHNEYMKEYSWAEETNAELLNIRNL